MPTFFKVNISWCTTISIKIFLLICGFSTDSWSISQRHTNETRAHKWLDMAHYKAGVSTIKTERSKTL